MSRRPRILMIGPLPRREAAIGGTQVSFGALVDDLRRRGALELDVLDTTRDHAYVRDWRMRCADLARLVGVSLAVLLRGRSCDAVVFNASAEGALLGGPLLWAATRAIRRPMVTRVFGGGLDDAIGRLPAPLRALARRTVLRSELLLLQTGALCRAFAGCPGVRHMPTTRRPPSSAPPQADACRRFLFLSQLRPEKGLFEALTSIELAPEGCTLSVAGPLLPGVSLAALNGSSRSRYLGAIEPSAVAELLARHDALVFPSYWAGEGLPGVVIEALQHGLPVIATRWRALPELIAHGVNGLLVEPRDAGELAGAMRALATDAALFHSLREGALETGREHSAEVWTGRFEAWIASLTGRGAPASALPPAALEQPPAALPAATPRQQVER